MHNSFTKWKGKLLIEKKEEKKMILHEPFICNFVSEERKKKKKENEIWERWDLSLSWDTSK